MIDRGWVEPRGEPKYRQYRISSKFFTDMDKRFYERQLAIWGPDETYKKWLLYYSLSNSKDFFSKGCGFVTPNSDDIFSGEKSDFLLCGLPRNILDKLSDKEKKDLNNWLLNIEEYLWKIMELKYEKMKKTRDELIKILDIEPIEHDVFALHSIGFYYNARKSLVIRKE